MSFSLYFPFCPILSYPIIHCTLSVSSLFSFLLAVLALWVFSKPGGQNIFYPLTSHSGPQEAEDMQSHVCTA